MFHGSKGRNYTFTYGSSFTCTHYSMAKQVKDCESELEDPGSPACLELPPEYILNAIPKLEMHGFEWIVHSFILFSWCVLIPNGTA